MRTTIHILAATLLTISFAASASTGDEDDIDSLWGDSGTEDGSRDGDSYQWYTPEPDPPSREVTLPSSGTVWEHGQTGVRIEWKGFEGEEVRIELLESGQKIADLRPWHASDGEFVRSAPVPEAWGSGEHFQVRVAGRSGEAATSEEFQILAPFTIVTPNRHTFWAHNQEYPLVSWTSIAGQLVRIDLCRAADSSVVTSVGGWIPNEGSYRVPLVSSEWGTGEDFLLRITDDLGNYTYSQPFAIYGIRVDSPTAGDVWEVGRTPPQISWSCMGTLVKVELYRESEAEPETVLADWMPNTGSLTLDRDIDGSVLDVGGRYLVKITNDMEQVGYSRPFEVAYSDNVVLGAGRLAGTASGRIDPAGDNDYWMVSVPQGKLSRVQVESEIPMEVSVLTADSNRSTVASSVSGRVEWFSETGGEYYVNVASTSAEAAGAYRLEYSYSRPVSAGHSWVFSLSGGGALGGYRDVADGRLTIGVGWLPYDWLEVGLNLTAQSIEPGIYAAEPCSTKVYTGPYAGVRTGIFRGLSGFAGIDVMIGLDNTERELLPEYQKYDEALAGGSGLYLGLDHPLFSLGSLGMYLQARYMSYSDTDGLFDVGLYGAL